MPILFIEYTELVLRAFEERRDGNLLSQLLADPTTASIKKACYNVYVERKTKGEEEKNMLESFFGVPAAGRDFRSVIDQINPDKFRPIQKLIQRKVKNPKRVTVELLAWLIDFKPRPLARAQNLNLTVHELKGTTVPTTDNPELDARPGAANTTEQTTEDIQLSSDSTNGGYVLPGTENHATPPETVDNGSVGNKIIPAKTFKRRLILFAAMGAIATALFGGGYWLSNAGIFKPATNTATTAKNQCRAITKKGTVCTRKATNKGYCWQHDS